MKISDEAVEAARRAREACVRSIDWAGDDYPDPMRAALEAAAPHLAPAVPQPVDREALAEFLSEHQIEPGVGRWLGQYRTEYDCRCGAKIVTNAHAEVSLEAATVAHQSEALLALLAGEQEQVAPE